MRSNPEESTIRRNFSIASKFIDGVRSDDLRAMLATYYTLSADNASTPEEMRQKSREYMIMKPKKYSFSENRNMHGEANNKGRLGTNLETTWTNEGHVQTCGSSHSELYNIQARYEKLRICARRRRHESNGRKRVLLWFDYQDRREVLYLQSRGPFQNGLSPVLGGSEESTSPET